MKVPFFSSMVTVSLAHFMRNLYLDRRQRSARDGRKQAWRGRSSALTSVYEEKRGKVPHELHIESVSLLLEVGLSCSISRCKIINVWILSRWLLDTRCELNLRYLIVI